MQRRGDLRAGELREETGIQSHCSTGCSGWGAAARDGSGGASWGWVAVGLWCNVQARVSKQVLRKMTGESVENRPDQGTGRNCCRRPSLDEENLN